MTFDASVPVSSDDPGLFPAQNQTNMGRLQTLLGADHQFNLSSATDDGYHNLVHLTPQAPSGSLSGYGRLYAKTYNSVMQLYYMDDGGTEHLITPGYVTYPLNISGSQSIAAGASVDILDVSYNWTGVGCAFVVGAYGQTTYSFNRTSSAVNRNQLNSNTGAGSPPTIEQSGTKLQVKNNAGSTRTIGWSLQINRLA